MPKTNESIKKLEEEVKIKNESNKLDESIVKGISLIKRTVLGTINKLIKNEQMNMSYELVVNNLFNFQRAQNSL